MQQSNYLFFEVKKSSPSFEHQGLNHVFFREKPGITVCRGQETAKKKHFGTAELGCHLKKNYLDVLSRKLGPMVRINGFNLLTNGIYWGCNPLILTFDP